MNIRNFTLLLISLFFFQCSSNSKIVTGFERSSDAKFILGEVKTNVGYVTNNFMDSLKENIIKDLKSNNLLYSESPNSLYNVYKLDVDIKKYKVLGGNKRDIFGVFAGKDTVLSDIKIIDMKTHKVVGEYLSTTIDGSGLKYKEDILSNSHAKEIVKFIGGE